MVTERDDMIAHLKSTCATRLASLQNERDELDQKLRASERERRREEAATPHSFIRVVHIDAAASAS